jgi:hypothetical protein
MAQYPTSAATDSDLYVAVNQLSTVLNGSLDASQTTVTVTSTTGFPTVGFITVDSEVIKYTSTNSTQFLSCTRGADGTGATTHSSGATVKHAVTAAHHNALKDEVKAVESDLVNGMSRVINMNSHKITNLTNGTVSSDAVAFGQLGSQVKQMVVYTSTTVFTTTNATYQTTNLSGSITPSSTSSKILVIATGVLGAAAGVAFTSISRNGSNVVADRLSEVWPGVADAPCTMIYLDSPASVASTSYAVILRNQSGGSSCNFGDTNLTQYLLLIEVL